MAGGDSSVGPGGGRGGNTDSTGAVGGKAASTDTASGGAANTDAGNGALGSNAGASSAGKTSAGSGGLAGVSGTAGLAGSSNGESSGGIQALGAAIVCANGAAPDPSTKTLAPDARQSFSGTNGTFTDSCDENGDLTAYECEFEQVPDGDGTFPKGTGAVAQTTIPCDGACVGGTCVGACAQPGDKMQIVSSDDSGNATLEDEATHWSYACQVYANSCGPQPPGTEFQLIDTDGCWQFGNNLIDVGNGPMGARCSYMNCAPVGHP